MDLSLAIIATVEQLNTTAVDPIKEIAEIAENIIFGYILMQQCQAQQ
ncbi:MAG: hypothetical protein IPK14_27915 [Blastocatellia bacterium]|nr:hypothetical protein [Blastocatellia bacterium]